jgi:hypothetical protein
MFYTYCPALDQFVDSELNRGLYPRDYLAANLANLKTHAELALRYGLIPGLLCFEPRSVPDAFFDRYPMLRGARVDHPFRSFKPRYNMTITHPKVRAHYAEMLTNLLNEVPALGFLSIWTNDSGAGFEHTQSLYVGRNGGAYLIREWKDAAQIAEAAGENALRFFRVLRDAARRINPRFRVMTRLESFQGEHDVIWRGLQEGIDVETASLMGRGWEMPYTHPRYPDSSAINAGSIYQQGFDERERDLAADLATRASRAHFYFSAGPHVMFAPLLGVPYPHLTFRRLKTLYENDVRFLAHLGGTFPPELVPFNINHAILRAFQFNPAMDPGTETARCAHLWAGAALAETLQKAWSLTEEAILAFPHVTPLYSAYGFVWYRLWVRPLVPNIEAIPDDERAYYQDHMCTTPHNPNNVDLSRDVLFELAAPEGCAVAVSRIDEHVWEPLDQAIDALESVRQQAAVVRGEPHVIEDTFIRLKALRCWFMTQRSVAAWIASVHGYVAAQSTARRQECRRMLDEMIALEIENSRQLLALLESGVPFMATTDQGENPLIHGENVASLLRTRIGLMEKHAADEPFIDPSYIERHAAQVQE